MNALVELNDAHVAQAGESRRGKPTPTTTPDLASTPTHTTACHHPAIDPATTESEAVT
ncbi:hypothetical protein ACQEV4_39250 [Streptomyces shenzhenensis]|uniref:hypothetical protein n=1 Tax=Streptomyces shenzhenensis TaxID=943815 RepID=UPI003D8FC6EB